ncbi:unnamed protein product, partial [Discosporangium mesarthrocarpum]
DGLWVHRGTTGSLGNESCSLLEQLIRPLRPSEFLREYFHRKALVLNCIEGGARHVQALADELLHGLDVESLLANTASDSIFVWVVDPASGKIRSIEIQDAVSAHHLFLAGHSTYCRAPKQAEDVLVGRLLSDVGMGLPAVPVNTSDVSRGEVELFCSRAGHATDWHIDFQENFTVQLSGRKRWKLRSSGVAHPLRGCTPHFLDPSVVEKQVKVHKLAAPSFRFNPGLEQSGDFEECTLGPGDVLYHPAGVWHRCEAMEDSVSISEYWCCGWV